MTAFYNDNDRKVCAWLAELCRRGLIAKGDISSDSIRYIDPERLDGYKQVHLFAGVGGWSYALRLAGWPDDEEVWTASCPCQPFSAAGKRKGTADRRHLWPEAFRLIDARRPAVVFGEQVSGRDGLGWLDGVFTDLESVGFACEAVDLPAASVGAPHIRQRLFWVANTQDTNGRGRRKKHAGRWSSQVGRSSGDSPWSDFNTTRFGDGKSRRIEPGTTPLAHGIPARVVRLRGYGNAIVPQVAARFIRAFMESSNG